MKLLIIATACLSIAAAAQAEDTCAPLAKAQTDWTCLAGTGPVGTVPSHTIQDAASWQRFFAAHGGIGQAPAVDFKREAIMVYLGADPASFKVVRTLTRLPAI